MSKMTTALFIVLLIVGFISAWGALEASEFRDRALNAAIAFAAFSACLWLAVG